jgi:hypothetical protein
MELAEKTDQKASLWVVRFFILLVALSWAIDLLGLQTRYAVFSDGTGWLAAVRFDSWSERCGLAVILGIFSVATSGTWILFLLGLSRLFRWDRFRVLAIGSSAWILALVIHLIVRQEVYEYFRDAFDLVDYKDSANGFWYMVEDIWSWFGTIILLGLGGIAVAGTGMFLAFRVIQKRGRSWGWIDRLSGRGILVATSFTLFLSILLLTLFSHRWRETRQMVQKTWVGWPLSNAVLFATDVDSDGYSPFGDPADVAPFDSTRHPYAVDIPGDNVDQNLLLGDFQLEKVYPADREEIDGWFSYPPVSFTERKNVIVVILESVRADALETTIDGREVTPRLRQAAKEGGLVVPRAYATRGFTINALEQMYWGGFHDPGSSLLDEFRENDYEIGVFSAYNFDKRDYRERLAFQKEEVGFYPEKGNESAPGEELYGGIEKWMRAREKEKPFFLYVHFDESHYPYGMKNELVFCEEPLAANQITKEVADQVRRQYLSQVYQVDRVCGKIMDLVRETGREEETILIFMSDHGESIFDDGIRIGHGTQINEVMTHCLMLVVNPGIDVPCTLSHYDIRGLVRKMLTTPAVESPKILKVPDKRILHYLYTIDTPTFLGEYSDGEGRLVYDLQDNRIRDERSGEEGYFREGSVSDDLFRRGARMVHRWEYLKFRAAEKHPRQ